jgi:hypothetical protein
VRCARPGASTVEAIDALLQAVTAVTESHDVPDEIMAVVLRRELLRLAAIEESLATAEAARVPYWAPCPDSVSGHRAAARALREDAERLMTRAA